jgi:hypothetical protein
VKPNATGFWYNAFLSTLTNDTFETVNRLTDQGLAAEYADLLTGFARNGVLERQRLRRIGSKMPLIGNASS